MCGPPQVFFKNGMAPKAMEALIHQSGDILQVGPCEKGFLEIRVLFL
jgi:hypothetical protein